LFTSPGRVYVRSTEDNQIVRTVDYSLGDTLKPGEYYDYDEFRSAKFFAETCVPIYRMVKKFKNIRKRQHRNSKLAIVTARADLDSKDIFMAALDKYGLAHDDVHVHRAGNYSSEAPTTCLRKVFIIGKLLDEGGYDKCRMFDDSYTNLRAFLEMKQAYPELKFEAWHVNHEGHCTRYKG
jgi:hypothetical protein